MSFSWMVAQPTKRNADQTTIIQTDACCLLFTHLSVNLLGCLPVELPADAVAGVVDQGPEAGAAGRQGLGHEPQGSIDLYRSWSG